MSEEKEVKEEKVEVVADAAEKPAKKVKKKRTRRKKKTHEEVWQELRDAAESDPMPYSMTSTYAANSVIDHPKWGLGVVTESLALKIEVTFQDAARSLVHKRQ